MGQPTHNTCCRPWLPLLCLPLPLHLALPAVLTANETATAEVLVDGTVQDANQKAEAAAATWGDGNYTGEHSAEPLPAPCLPHVRFASPAANWFCALCPLVVLQM